MSRVLRVRLESYLRSLVESRSEEGKPEEGISVEVD